jgi:tetratricopeptide (TPR) repeat protein
MKQPQNIYDDFYSLEINDYSGIISYYEKNSLYFDNKNSFKDTEDFFCFSKVVTYYVISLYNKGRYQKTLDYVDKFITVFSEQMINYEIDKNSFISYWSLLKYKGYSQYYLKQYKDSIKTFKILVEWDKENDSLKNWLQASQRENRTGKINYLYFVSMLLILMSVLIKNRFISKKLIIMGIIFLLIPFFNEYIYDKFLVWFNKITGANKRS